MTDIIRTHGTRAGRLRPGVSAVALALALLHPTGPAAAADGAIRRVTLSSGGLAEIVREVPVADGRVSFDVPLDQIDDVLKSLVVLGGGARVSAFSLGGPAPVEEAMRRLPFTAEEMASLPGLLGKLQGVAVEVLGAGPPGSSPPVSGTVLGVSMRQGPEGAQEPVLSLVDSTGAALSVPLPPEARVRILDEAVRNRIAEASAALGQARSDGARRVTLALDGAPGASAEIAYVVAAPLWKTAYRVVADGTSGRARLQGWAVLENASGESWEDVALTLTSGAPVTLRQRLFERYWRDRPEVPVDVAGVPMPEPDAGAMDFENVAQAASAPDAAPRRPLARAAPPPMPAAKGYAEMAAADAATAAEGDTSASFAIAEPVDLAAGDTLSVPILDETVAAERVSLLQFGDGGPHPLAALRLGNESTASLPPGILTLFDAREGYLGDAQLLGAAAGQSRLVSFALDRKVRILREEDPQRSLLRVRQVDGALSAEFRTRLVTRYRVEGAADGPRVVIVEHPRRAGWTFSGAEVEGETASFRRLRLALAAGGRGTIEAADERVESELYALDDADPDLVLSFASELSDPAEKAALTEIAGARRDLAAAETALAETQEERDRIAGDQGRVRENLAAVPEGSALARGYLEDLAGQEAELDRLAERRKALEAERRAHRAAMEAALRRL